MAKNAKDGQTSSDQGNGNTQVKAMKYAHLIETVSKPRPKAWIIGKTLEQIENKKPSKKINDGMDKRKR
jgi:hypothetical protein